MSIRQRYDGAVLLLGAEQAEELLNEARRLTPTMRANIHVEDLFSSLIRFAVCGMSTSAAVGFVEGANRAGIIGNATSLIVLEQMVASGRAAIDELRTLAENRL